MKHKHQLVLAGFILASTTSTALASARQDAVNAILALRCSYAAKVLDRHVEAEKLEALGEFLAKDIYERYSNGSISYDEFHSKLPRFFPLMVGERVPSEVTAGDIESLTRHTVEQFSELDDQYSRRANGKTGMAAFNARVSFAKEDFLEQNCESLLSFLK